MMNLWLPRRLMDGKKAASGPEGHHRCVGCSSSRFCLLPSPPPWLPRLSPLLLVLKNRMEELGTSNQHLLLLSLERYGALNLFSLFVAICLWKKENM